MSWKVEFAVRQYGDPGERTYSHELVEGKELVIGRSQWADLCITDRNISRRHCVVTLKGGTPMLIDRSKNGTLLGGERIATDAPLPAESLVNIGTTQIVIRLTRPPVAEFPSELVGQEVDGYQILEVLGEGTVGIVYKAYQTKMNRQVAIKTLSARHLTNQNSINRFLRMAKVAGQLNHPNIVQIYDSGHIEPLNLYYLVMEFVEGETLTEVLKREKTLDPQRSCALFLQLGSALAFANRKKIVHRDINPSNIMVGTNQVAKLVGLGLSKTLDDGVPALTQTGMAMGMINYIPPEQVRDAARADHRSDIFSMGAVFYKALTGQPPLATKTRREFFEIMRDPKDPPAPDQLNPAIPKQLSAILMDCVRVDPEKRYRTADEFVEKLRSHIEPRTVSRSAISKARKNIMAMFPSKVAVPGFEFESLFCPCDEIGGDFYDFVELGKGKIGITIGDVSGHGIDAAVVVGMAKILIKVFARQGDSPAETLKRVNHEIYPDLDPTTFLTAIYGVLDPADRTFLFSRAGHSPLILFNPERKPAVQQFEPRGSILGMMRSQRLDLAEEKIDLVTGDVVLQYTDGVIETHARNNPEEEFGVDRLVQVLSSHGVRPLGELMERIDRALHNYRGPGNQEDDITVTAFKVLEAPPRQPAPGKSLEDESTGSRQRSAEDTQPV